MRKNFIILGIGALLAGCAAQSQLPYMTPEQIRVAASKIETPAHLSTAQFKELGDSKRAEVMQRIVHNVWNERCNPVSVSLEGYFREGMSRWSVRCMGSALIKDYAVDLPERSDGNARVLKCFKRVGIQVTCDIIGHPAEQSQQTAQSN